MSAQGYAGSAGHAAKYAPQTAEVRQSEVLVEMDKLGATCDSLEKLVADLEQRLQPVLAQRSEGAGETQNGPEPVRVPLAQHLHTRIEHLSATYSRLQSIINRIEV